MFLSKIQQNNLLVLNEAPWNFVFKKPSIMEKAALHKFADEFSQIQITYPTRSAGRSQFLSLDGTRKFNHRITRRKFRNFRRFT